MRTTSIAVAIIATLAVAAAGFAADREVTAATSMAVGELQIRPTRAGGPGRGALPADGREATRLGGRLGPRAALATRVHFHGPQECLRAESGPVATHADLVADAHGVAYATVRIRSRLQVLRNGFYYNVHAKAPSASENPEIACANVVPIP